MEVVRIGTRGSKLALSQASWVQERLEEKYPGLDVQTVIIKTSGDRFLNAPIQAIGGKGIFVKEIEEALLRRKIDLAVHSMKDLPTELPSGLAIAAIPEREDSRDALVSREGRTLNDLPEGSKVGTGSLRRRAQLLSYRPDLSVVPIRGNIDTRLKKLDRGEIDALVMAVAGLRRLGWTDRITEYLAPEVCLSAVAQGALGIETRKNDPAQEMVSFLDHPATATEVVAERAFLRRLGGGCQIPVGARAWLIGKKLKMMGVVGDTEGQRVFREEIAGSAGEAEKLGQQLADKLLRSGAGNILLSKEGFRADGSA
ncbi:MAG: hydroxymethylbilane synthase [Deltaproteobacteria bacterium]|nr:hydroxymethylbilane synthase [Deltaproteobacteria bacterium]